MTLSTVRTVSEMRTQVRAWRADGLSVGLVPTMGALHAGHLSLVHTALSQCDRVIVSLFVNPTQFGEGEDFSVYPRDEDADRRLLESAGTDLLFAPSVNEMYPERAAGGAGVEVHVPALDNVLEGVYRPGHFTGVATVVSKLLLQSLADHAFFGEKDYQQLQVIKMAVRDLCIPTEIHGVPTLREDDGLAMSSRNRYLSAGERATAPRLYEALCKVATDFKEGGSGADLCRVAEVALADFGFGPVDYVSIADAATLEPLAAYDAHRPARILAAASLGRARLIDNIAVDSDD